MRKKSTNLRLFLFSILIICCGTASGQQVTVKGTVVDSQDNSPLTGATVVVQGSNRGTLVDAQGNYSISVSPTETVHFSYIGFDDLRLSGAKLAENPNITMVSNAGEMEELVVVGYGVQKKASTVAAITQTKGEDLLKGGNINSVGEALQGRLNGVTSISKTGRPGGNDAEIYIRGKSSWVSSKPLVLVDGIERNFNDVDMNEIESVSVLKDASATAVYGVRGANGVILLTSKQGSITKPKVNFTSNFGFKQPTAKLNWAPFPVSQKLWNEAMANDGTWSNLIPESTLAAWENAFATGNHGPYNDVFPDVDWYDVMMKKLGTSQNYNINITGGTEFMKYFSSVGYQNDGDAYNIKKEAEYDPRYWYKRYNWRSNFDFQLTPTTQFYISVSGSMSYRNGGYGDEIFTATLQSPSNIFPVKYSNGEWGETSDSWFNILANTQTRGSQSFQTLKSYYDAKLSQKLDFLTKGLSIRGQLSFNTLSRTRSNIVVANVLGNDDGLNNRNYSSIRYYRQYDYANPIVNPDGTLSYTMINQVRRNDDQIPVGYPAQGNYDALDGYNRMLYYEFALDYARSFGHHNVSALAVFNRQVFDQLSSSSTMAFPNYREDWVGRVTYNWKEKYLFEWNMAYTGSEMFAPSNRFGFFPSASVGWRVTEEPFMKNIKKVVTNLKVRYSWGQSGSHSVPSDAPKYNYIQVFETGGTINLGEQTTTQYGPLFKEPYAADLNTGWETGTKQNLGLEMGFWHKLKVSLDLFDEQREGIMMKARTTASWFGTGFPMLNLGKTKNHGLELDMSWNDKIGRDFKYNVNFAFSASENRVVDRNDPRDFAEHLKDAGKPIGFQSRYITVGNFGSISDIFNYAQTNIVAPTIMIPGDLVHIDYNGDGVIDANDNVVVKQLDYPLWVYSLGLGFEWKGIGVSALIYSPQGVYKDQFNQFFLDFPSSQIKAQPTGLDRWTKETANDVGVIRPSVHANALRGHNDATSTYKYVDYSYIRLKSVEVSYTFDKKLTKKIDISNLTLYANGNNLLTFSKVDKRVDPETSGSEQYPIVRSYTLGVRLSF